MAAGCCTATSYTWEEAAHMYFPSVSTKLPSAQKVSRCMIQMSASENTQPREMFCLPAIHMRIGNKELPLLICCLYAATTKGYDVPADSQLAVDLAALGMLSVLLQLFRAGVGNRLLFRLGQTLEVELVNLDGHPAKKGRETAVTHCNQ